MRTRAVLGSLFASAAVLVIGWQAGESVLASEATATSQPVTTVPATTVTNSTDTTTATPTPTSEPVATGPADGTYTGASVDTRFGSVQVAVTVSGGSITDVTALALTDADADGKSVQISNRAAPILRDEVIASQSANVANVSGATYTTDAYLQSVQSALDQAGL